MTDTLDCSKVLQFAATAETSTAVATSFGHPDPPQLALQTMRLWKMDSLATLVVAYTDHTVTAQWRMHREHEQDTNKTVPDEEPILGVCQLMRSDQDIDDDTMDEYITCLAIVVLDSAETVDAESAEMADAESELMPVESSSTSTTSQQQPMDTNITGSATLMTGVVSTEGEEDEEESSQIFHTTSQQQTDEQPRIAILLGTNTSRVYTVELVVVEENDSWQLQHASILTDTDTLFQVFPLDNPKKRRRRHAPILFSPTGGVTHLLSLPNAVWITYGDGTLLRVAPRAMFPGVWQAAAAEHLSVEDYTQEPLWRGQVLLPPAPPGKGNVLLRVVPQNTIVLALPQEGNDLSPTVCFYAANQHNSNNDEDPATEEVEQETENAPDNSSTVSTMSWMGRALRWSFRGNGEEEPTKMTVDTDLDEVEKLSTPTVEPRGASTPFPSLYNKPPVALYAGQEIHDAPRKIESCIVDPDGRYAAATDGLGRVVLIDVTCQQFVRLWKGYRDANIGWIQIPQEGKKPHLFLAIHSKQRRAVEVWRVRLGPRVNVIPVSKEAKLVPCWQWDASLQEYLASCYLIQSPLPGTGLNLLERVSTVSDGAHTPDTMSATKSVVSNRTSGARRAAQRLQHLHQLLSSDATKYTKEDVRKALQDIRSLSDLSAALDLLACAVVLENELEVKGAEFQKEAVSYCRGVLNAALHRGKSRGDVAQNPHVQLLTHKLEYHTQIVKAFDCLYKFENTKSDGFQQKPVVLSTWASEAMSWATTSEKVTKEKLENEINRGGERLLFAEFASACIFPEFSDREKSTRKVYFSESSRTRRDVVANVFRPLLADVFSFNVVYAVFDSLGIRADCRYIEKCFGEWFMTLSIEDVYRRGLNAENPPMVRLLQDLVARQLSVVPIADDMVALEELHAFCCKSKDLVRSFLLATMCLNAVTRAAGQKEKWSYGKVSSSKMVDDWIVVLRKLRVCLLVSLRMHGKRLVAPITIDNVEQPDIFSVYEWLARDELTVAQSHDEIVALEQTCANSSHAFDPSTEEGDGPSRFKVLQSSCLAASISEDERAEYLVDVDRFEVLLLFLSKFNRPMILAAHRALIAALDWGATPSNLDLLRNALETLKSLHGQHKSLTAAVGLEIWQSKLCPIYRAHLFGFHDVQELSEEVISPLLQDMDWVTTVGRFGLELLEILQDCGSLDNDEEDLFAEDADSPDNKSWPPIRPDCVLQKLMGKLVPEGMDHKAFDAHSVVVCALLVSGDLNALTSCVPSIYELFHPHSLFESLATSPQIAELQQSYLNEAMINFASKYTGAIMEKFDLQEISTLAKIWSFDKKRLNARFLLVMYEVGKDEIVDELVTKCSTQIDVHTFVDGGLDVACRRLNVFITGHNARSVLGLLDAEMCSWISQRTKKSSSLVNSPELHMPIGNTHLFILRLLTLSAGSHIESPIRMKIHSLSVLSGILIKALAQTSAVS